MNGILDAAGTTTYSYTAFGAVGSEDGPWDNDTVSYTYDNGRRRSQLSLAQPNASAWLQTYAYDTANRLNDTASPAGAFAYLHKAVLSASAPGRLIYRLDLPNGAYVTNVWDGRGRLTDTYLRDSTGATDLNFHRYAYNDAHQRTNQTRYDNSLLSYTYDGAGQLKTALGKESGGADRLHEQFRYTYDPADNLSNRVQNVLTNVFNVNSLNALTTVTRTTNLTLAGFTTTNASSVTVNNSSATL